MSARARVLSIVALAAVAAVAATIGVTLLQTRGESTSVPGAVGKPRAGAPPLDLNFGLRDDAQARALTRAARLYNQGKRAQAAKVFASYRSLEAQIGAAFATWPGHALDDVKRLVASHPRSSLAELHLALAYYWSGRNADALAAFRRAEQLQPDTPYALTAAVFLHPEMPPQLVPVFVPSRKPPAGIARLSNRAQVAALARLAARGDANGAIYYGIALQELGHRVSAERAFATAAAAAPNDPEALTAAAVGRFTKDQPQRAFSRLGPLAQRFPRSAVVRFHLGYLLVWIGSRTQAAKELRKAVADAPQSVYGKEARLLLASLAKNGTR